MRRVARDEQRVAENKRWRGVLLVGKSLLLFSERPPDSAARVHGVGRVGGAGEVQLLPAQLSGDQDAAGECRIRRTTFPPV